MADGISTEGKLGILLSLIGIGGAGALFVFPHPYADYVGWSLIAMAVVGLVLMAIYHFARTSRAMVIAVAIAVTAAMLWLDYWYYSNYSFNGGIWHISLSLGLSPAPPPNSPEQQQPTSGPAVPPTLRRHYHQCQYNPDWIGSFSRATFRYL